MAELAGLLDVRPAVLGALAERRPVVALESALVTHGLSFPANLEVALDSERAVHEAGATPATVAIHDGRLIVGLGPAELEALAQAPNPYKASRASLASALAAGGWAGTTVAATMIAARVSGIHVFATGGIGGVHHGALGGPGPVGAGRPRLPPTFDVSADLEELARTPILVVCSGPKAILDVPATLEYLETRGVPVVALGSSEVPGFFSRSSGLTAPHHVRELSDLVPLIVLHQSLGLGSAVLICVPVPEADELARPEAERAVRQAAAEAEVEGVAGSALSPWLLGRVAELTDGRSARANRALIVHNARTAAALATLMTSWPPT